MPTGLQLHQRTPMGGAEGAEPTLCWADGEMAEAVVTCPSGELFLFPGAYQPGPAYPTALPPASFPQAQPPRRRLELSQTQLSPRGRVGSLQLHPYSQRGGSLPLLRTILFPILKKNPGWSDDSATPVPRDPTPSSGLCGHLHVCT
ncbi:intestinal cell kinase, isoform CRA_b [Rattus norvegicus]|uniref:Intestinal cell kinase, isoform CRA_b n=1 Tax=Rattus norvegicus TaxID=10116 RepID=A6I1H9_RAT|nr:intestinal cell kinase, isoform CRA_b [Rattus norvegicus]